MENYKQRALKTASSTLENILAARDFVAALDHYPEYGPKFIESLTKSRMTIVHPVTGAVIGDAS